MAANEIHLGDIGTIFEITLMDGASVVDISTQTLMQIKFKKPKSAVVTQTAVFKTDGTDGILQYVTVLDDLDELGTWKIQAYVELASGSKHNSDIGTFTVYANL